MPVKGWAQDVRWGPFGAICAAYLAVTVGESALAPLYPVIAADLGADLGGAGLALGSLAASIAVANIAGGVLLARRGPRTAITTALALVVAGGTLSALAPGLPLLLVGQLLLGLAAGTFFAPGIHVVGVLGGATRRGLVMGIFGIAFSGGLALAALLTLVGDQVGWRTTFAVVAALGLAGVVTLGLVSIPDRPERVDQRPAGVRESLRRIMGRATGVGAAAAVSQYGTVAFFPIFAVEVWDLSAGRAALLLAAGRVISIPAKTIAGHLSDTHGALWTVRGLGVALVGLGLAWTLAPSAAVGAVPAALFAGTVSAAFPVANLLAFEQLAGHGPLLGAYRSTQMGAGALAAGAIGAGAALGDLRTVLVVTLLAPGGLILAGRAARAHAVA